MRLNGLYGSSFPHLARNTPLPIFLDFGNRVVPLCKCSGSTDCALLETFPDFGIRALLSVDLPAFVLISVLPAFALKSIDVGQKSSDAASRTSLVYGHGVRIEE